MHGNKSDRLTSRKVSDDKYLTWKNTMPFNVFHSFDNTKRAFVMPLFRLNSIKKNNIEKQLIKVKGGDDGC